MDFYVILGVNREATLHDVQRAYKRLARRYHPDINPGDHEAAAFFRRVSEAYETLSDAGRRQEYDAYGEEITVSRSDSVEFQGFDFSASVSGASATFAELFEDVLGSARDATAAEVEKGSDLYGEVALEFEEALQGAERKFTVTRLEQCSVCGGTEMRRAPESRCGNCNGEGMVRWRRGHMVFSKSCTNCEGSGRQRHRPCSACRAGGVVSRTEEIVIQIPAGLADGARLRVPGKGNTGRGGGPSGDLYITATVGSHELFRRDGDDVHVQVPVAIHEAALGAKIEIPTVDGLTRLRIPPGTQTGQRFRLRGRGAPSPRTSERGDLIVEVRLVLPRLDDERSKELMREFGKINGDDVRRRLFASDGALRSRHLTSR